MDFLKQLFERILSIFPRIWLVEPNEGGVRCTCGKYYRSIRPGAYLYWPLIQNITTVNIAQQIKDIRCQSVMTQDRVDMAAGGAIKYRIKDACAAILKVQDYDQTLQALSLGIISRYINNRNYADINSINDIEGCVLKGIREDARGWGIDVMSVYITDLGRAQNIRLLTNGNVSIGGITNETSQVT